MAAILGISDGHLRKLALLPTNPMPKIGDGLYPVAPCILWYIKYWQDKALGREANESKKVREDSAATLMRIKAEEAAGLVVSRAAVVNVAANANASLGRALDQVPRLAAQKLNLGSEAQRVLRGLIDDARRAYVSEMSEFEDPVEDAAD